MFDNDDPISSKMWRKLAMNLLYAMPSKNVTTNFSDNSKGFPKHNVKGFEPTTPITGRAGSISNTASVLKRQSTRRLDSVSARTSDKALNNFANFGSESGGDLSPMLMHG